jgi:para-aminobenzoate synthetase
VFDAWYSDSPHAFWLDSSSGGRFSFMGDASGPLARVAAASVPDGTVTVTGADGEAVRHSSAFFDWLRDDLQQNRIGPAGLPFGFALGWVGYLGYELKAECGGAAKHHAPHPDAGLIFADRAVAFDHADGSVYAMALAQADDADDAEAARAWLADAAARLTALSASLACHPSDCGEWHIHPTRFR